MEFIGLRVAASALTERPEIARLHRAPASGKVAPVARRAVYFATRGQRVDTPIYLREALPVGAEITGPAVIQEFGATTVIAPGDRLRVGTLGEFVIELAS